MFSRPNDAERNICFQLNTSEVGVVSPTVATLTAGVAGARHPSRLPIALGNGRHSPDSAYNCL